MTKKLSEVRADVFRKVISVLNCEMSFGYNHISSEIEKKYGDKFSKYKLQTAVKAGRLDGLMETTTYIRNPKDSCLVSKGISLTEKGHKYRNENNIEDRSESWV